MFARRSFYWVITSFLFIWLPVYPAVGQAAVLEGIKLQPWNKFTTYLYLQNRGIPDYEIFENLDKRVIVIKFRDSLPNTLLQSSVYTDPVIEKTEVEILSKEGYSLKSVDFKESAPWNDLKWQIIRTALAMGNLRDGGIIVVGASERDDTCDLT